jgi:hypothetical protein
MCRPDFVGCSHSGVWLPLVDIVPQNDETVKFSEVTLFLDKF